MNTRFLTAVVLVLVLVSFFSLTTPAAFAQAGLSGNAFSGQEDERLGRNSNFDNGKLKSQSALGQLEEISGGKVDRSSSSSSNRKTNTRPVQQPQPAKPRYDANQVFKQELTGALAGALVGALFNNLLNDNSAQQRAQAEAAAAQRKADAEAQAEAFRVQEELARLARIQKAQHYRADWDAREGDITDRLGGAFDFHPAATSFFGTNPNPGADVIAALIGQPTGSTNADAAEPRDAPNDPPVSGSPEVGEAEIVESDSSVIDLRGSPLVVNPINGIITTSMPTRSSGSLMPRWAYEMQESPRSSAHRGDPGKLEGLLALLGPVLGKFDKNEVIIGMIKSAIWDKAKKRLPFSDYGEAVYDFNEERIADTEELGSIYGEQMQNGFGRMTDVVGTLASRSTSDRGYIEKDSASLDYDSRKMVAKIYKMTLGKISGRLKPSDDEEADDAVGANNLGYLNDVPDPTITQWRGSAIRR